MILGIDVGGTKTLLGMFDDQGIFVDSFKFPTPALYPDFLSELHSSLSGLIKQQKVDSCSIAIPGRVDREKGVGVAFSNLSWSMIPIVDDIKSILECPVYLDNDAKMAALGEAAELKGIYDRVLYVTISTGIGMGLVVDGKLNYSLSDAGGRSMYFEHGGSLRPWESFASGKAIYEEFGVRASEITDKKIWEDIAERWIVGFIELITLTSPDIIVIGGGVGSHFDKYGSILIRDLKKYESPMLTIPPIRQAKRPEEAVIYGCYQLSIQNTN